jgi:hypothetical protein
MSRGALEGERSLSLPVPAVHATRAASGYTSINGWTGTGTADILMFEAYFDTSGYTSDDLTLFPMGAALQDPGRYLSTSTGGVLQVLDLITQTRLSQVDVENWLTQGAVPGMIGTDVDFTQILWGQYRTFLGQATFQGATQEYLPANGSPFGSGSPSTAQKLYCYRFVYAPASQANETISLPASRFILQAVIAEEEEKAFLMRQKRSYELAS